MTRTTYSIIYILFTALSVFGQGRIIIPEPPPQLPAKQVELKNVDAQIRIKENVGTVTLEQSFTNPSRFRLEGEYLFAIPDDANVNEFYLYIDGKKTKGRVLDAQEANKIYTDIVRSMRDPALLEFVGHGLFKARIFPIEPNSERKIELSYNQILRQDNNMYRFTLPIRQCGQGSIAQYHMKIELEADRELANIYSPSHQVQINRKDDRHVIITMEQNNIESTNDLIIYYSLSENEINANLFTFRPRTDKDGYFLFYASPKYQIDQKKMIAKDFIFVIDVSGSMQGEKIEQARDALKFCVNGLNKEDRFEIITFSSSINNFQRELKKAGQDEIENARYFINNLDANGGTNINEAMLTALKLKTERNQRPTNIVFLTDGLPTEGEQDINKILTNIKNAGNNFIRIFSFGVGYDVNTYLLDKISSDSHGSANYVKPGENIEREISTLFAKISSPVLTDPQIDFADANVYDVYPQKLPDLFKGQAVIVTGRYRNPGDNNITLSGKQGNNTRKFEYKMTFDRRNSENDFVDNIWANKKVSHLLTQIRFNGENKELVESVKALGKEYGIVTPYTSYLVTEQKEELAEIERRGVERLPGVSIQRMQSKQAAREKKAEADEEALGGTGFFDALSNVAAAPSSASGKGAVMSSRVQKKIANTQQSTEMLITMKRVANKTFYLKNGIWTENGIDDYKNSIKIDFLSNEYFDLLQKDDQLKDILAIGERIIFKWDNKIYEISN
ncbi:MAG: VIT domain-containing protein [Calditrichaceae bacterium]